jgi:8-oxo-dGTP diphosphatase
MTYTYKYPRPSLTVDIAVLKEIERGYEVLLIQRKNKPFEGMWALPGGFVDMDETVETAASRELFEETNLSGIYLEQFHVFSEVDRDPRGRTISVVFTGFLKDNQEAKAKDDAKEARWFDVKKLPELAFDHRKIMDKLLEKRIS